MSLRDIETELGRLLGPEVEAPAGYETIRVP